MTGSPVRVAGTPVGASPAEPARAPVPILIVDNNATKRLALKSVLLPLGYEIVEADSGVAALRCVMALDFAVILLDVRMPGMDGFETAALIRQRRQSEMTPIIFITAHGQHEIDNPDRYAEGAVDFMFAPVQPDELRAKVSVFANLFLKAELLAARARAVQTSADQLRLLTDAAPVGIFQTDVDNCYVYTNPRWSEITGVPAEQAAGQAWDSMIGDEQEVTREADDEAGGAEELGRRFEIELPGLGRRIMLVTSRSMPDSDGGIAGWVGTLADVTAEAGAEAVMSDARDAATEGSRLKSDFLANMSHEIRTPMNGVLGMTDLLLETDLDSRQRDYAQTVRNSGEALMTILNDILDFSKIEAGKVELEEIDFSVRAVVDGVTDLLGGAAQSKGLELVVIVDSSVPALVTGDPGRVRQVLTNLVGNAIKFTRSGEIAIRASVTEAVGAGAVVRFEVTDTGDGIAPDNLGSIFQPFVQADSSTSRRYGGTGLGLAISGQLVALMGGDCGVSSDLGRGSTFWFTVHVVSDGGQPADELLSPHAELAGVTALIVDDNATQRAVLSEYLTGWGMRVTSVGSGGDALTALRTDADRNGGFAVALVDRHMPGMDGLELMGTVVADASLQPGLVLMTDLGQEVQRDDPARSSACASLTKPIHPEDLLACLRVALGLEASEPGPADSAAQSPSAVAPPATSRLLLAEDNLINQQVAIAMLASVGYEVDTVPDGAAAVKAVAERHYDAVLMDCQMPELNGYQATAAIRAREGSADRVPIIAMTAGARKEDRERCLAAGMDDYLAKPVSKEALLALVARAVNGHRGAVA
jgi:two-component system, sensor histidine kinase and response regulator